MEALRIVADVEAAHREATVRRGPDDGEPIDDGDILSPIGDKIEPNLHRFLIIF